MTLNVTSIERVSTDASGDEIATGAIYPSFSPDDGEILFTSFSPDLVPNDTNNANDVFVKNLTGGAIELVTATTAGVPGNGFSDRGFFLPDGEHVFFTSRSSDLVPNDTNNDADFFIRDLTTVDVTRVNGNPDPDHPNFYFFADTTLSQDGTKVAFVSDASDMVPNDNNNASDSFIMDVSGGGLTRITNSSGVEGDGQTSHPSLSPDNTKVVFASYADNMVANDGNGTQDVFLKDLITGDVTLISASTSGGTANLQSYEPVFSPDGHKVAFTTEASDLLPGGNLPGIYVKDLNTGELTLVSSFTGQARSDTISDQHPVFSPDGTEVAFIHQHVNPTPGGPTLIDIYIKDLITSVLSKVSTDALGIQGDGFSTDPHFSSDGTKLLFTSDATNLVANDHNGAPDIFMVTLVDDHTINGTGGNDVLGGRDVAETFNAGEGDDRVEAGGGNDIINGGKGNDVLFGEAGADTVIGNGGDDRLFGGNDNDSLYGQDGNDTFFGEQGDDYLEGGKGSDMMFGDQGNDTLHGNTDNDVIYGQDGDDNVLGDGGNDFIDGGAGKDNLHGGSGNDYIWGGGSTDRLYGDSGDDELHGGSGTNWITGGTGADKFFIDIQNFDGTLDKVTDFKLAEGDTLHISPILEHFDPVTSAITDFVKATQVGSDTVISIDRDGPAALFTSYFDVMTLRGVTGLDIQDMYNNGQLVVHTA